MVAKARVTDSPGDHGLADTEKGTNGRAPTHLWGGSASAPADGCQANTSVSFSPRGWKVWLLVCVKFLFKLLANNGILEKKYSVLVKQNVSWASRAHLLTTSLCPWTWTTEEVKFAMKQRLGCHHLEQKLFSQLPRHQHCSWSLSRSAIMTSMM